MTSAWNRVWSSTGSTGDAGAGQRERNRVPAEMIVSSSGSRPITAGLPAATG